MQQKFNQEYELLKKIGQGAFGQIWAGKHIKTKMDVAVKLQKVRAKHPQLIYQAKILRYLRQPPASQPDAPFTPPQGVPVIYWFGNSGQYNVMVMQLLGASLEDLFNYCNREFTLLTILRIALQILTRLEYLHQRGFIHRDIKPDNFVVGQHSKAENVYIIDFGLAKRYRLPGTHQHIQFRDDKSLTGTARYASVNNHLGVEQSRRDDLESLAYVLIYFMKAGKLPWQGLKANNKHQKYQLIMEKKLATTISSLCKDIPQVFQTFLTYVRSLKFEQKPDYPYIRWIFQEVHDQVAGSTFSIELDWIRVYKKHKRLKKEKEKTQQKQAQQLAISASKDLGGGAHNTTTMAIAGATTTPHKGDHSKME